MRDKEIKHTRGHSLWVGHDYTKKTKMIAFREDGDGDWKESCRSSWDQYMQIGYYALRLRPCLVELG